MNDLDGAGEGGAEEDCEDDMEWVGKEAPISVLYDEIDSHVGGRAAVAVAKLLSNQGKVRSEKLSRWFSDLGRFTSFYSNPTRGADRK